MALQYASEDFLVEVFRLANLAAIHHKRITVAPKDIQLVKAMTYSFKFMVYIVFLTNISCPTCRVADLLLGS